MEWIWVVAVVLVAYLVILAAGRFTHFWSRSGVSAHGPVLLWRTRRGIAAIQRLARPTRLWDACSSVGAALAVVTMVVLTLFLFWVSYGSAAAPGPAATPDEDAPGLPTESLGQALFYGGLGIVIAVIVHEIGHGVVAASNRLRLDSLGIVFVVLPVGAFVEPNDDDLGRAGALTRMKVYAAGAAANMAVAAVCLAMLTLLVAPAASPVEEGVIVTDVAQDSPGDVRGVTAWSEVVAIGDTPVEQVASFEGFWFDSPGGLVSVEVRYGDEKRFVLLPQGLAVTEVFDGPAQNAGLRAGMIIQSLDGTPIHSERQFRSVIENATHDAPVPITVLVPSEDPLLGDWFAVDDSIVTVNLTSKWIWYYTHYNYLNKDEYKNLSFMGIGVSPFGLTVVESDHLTRLYAHPFDDLGDLVDSTVRLLALPFMGYAPVLRPATDLYDPGTVPDAAFWTLVNVLYWIFWGNVMLGFANAMPALPFDGGYMFRDMLRWLFAYPRSRLKGIEKVTHQRKLTDPGEAAMVRVLTWTMTVATLVLVAWLLLDPWI